MNNWTLDIADDLYRLQHPEDGSEFLASMFYITATCPNGFRYAHNYEFRSAHVGTQGIASYYERALAGAQRLLARIEMAPDFTPVDNPLWREIQPAYGSTAYEMERREEDLLDLERQDKLDDLASDVEAYS